MCIWLYRVVSKCSREQLLIAARIINMMYFSPFVSFTLAIALDVLFSSFIKVYVSLRSSLFRFLSVDCCFFWCVYTVFDLIQCARWMQKNEHAAHSRLCWLINIFMADSWTLVMFCSLSFVVALFFSSFALASLACRPHHYTRSYSHTTNTIIVRINIGFLFEFRFFFQPRSFPIHILTLLSVTTRVVVVLFGAFVSFLHSDQATNKWRLDLCRIETKWNDIF